MVNKNDTNLFHKNAKREITDEYADIKDVKKYRDMEDLYWELSENLMN